MALSTPEPAPDALVERVFRSVQAGGLLRPGPVAVAVSGGQDSVCMLDILRRLRERLGIDLHVAHLNHMLRGTEAGSEAGFVRDLAAEWALPATVAAIDVPSYRARHRLAWEVAARYARYQFLASVAGSVGAGQVAVGHTADDLVETLLMNLIRGAGLAGLRGLLPLRPLVRGQLGPSLEPGDWRTPPLSLPDGSLPLVTRPITALFRAETEEYCRARGLEFRQDLSNLDTTYRRNWIREELLPLLSARVPEVRARLLDTAGLLAGDYEVVSGVVDEAWSRVARAGEGRVEFDLERWRGLPTAVQRHLLRRTIEQLTGKLEDVGKVHIESGVALLQDSPVGARLDLPGGVVLEKGYTTFQLRQGDVSPASPPSVPEEPVHLPVPGFLALPVGTVESEVSDVTGPADQLLAGCEGRWTACLDADLVGPVLLVRRRRRGDRFVPLGMEVPKKLHDFFVDEKVPRSERDRVPLVTTPDQLVWIVGYRLDDRFKVRRDTRRVLKLSFHAGA